MGEFPKKLNGFLVVRTSGLCLCIKHTYVRTRSVFVLNLSPPFTRACVP